MPNNFFDYEDGDYYFTSSDSIAFNLDGDMVMRVGDNMIMDMESGELHVISGWPRDDDDE